MERNIWEVQDLIHDWFQFHEINILNTYVISLIVIEQLHSKKKDKNILIDDAVHFVLNYLIEKELIGKKRSKVIEERILEEKDVLKGIKELVFEISNSPNLFQKNKFINKEEKKIKRSPSMDFSSGKIRKKIT